MTEPDLKLDHVRAALGRWGPRELAPALETFRRRRQAEQVVEADAVAVRGALVRWTPTRLGAALDEFRFRRGEPQPRPIPLLMAAGATALAVLAGVVGWARGDSTAALATLAPRSVASVAAVAAAPAHVRLDDGSELTLQEAKNARVTESSPSKIVVTLDRGWASFRVPHRPERVFFVQAGEVLIEDLGTVFHVERGSSSVLVEVSEGKVRVHTGDELDELTAGERGSYPLEKPAAPAAAVASSGRAPTASAMAKEPKPGWRAMAQQHKYAGAFELLAREGFDSVRDQPEDLLLAADVARLSNHAGQAEAPLRRLSDRHPSDPRAPAAAFTLGSILLRDLGRPADAARAFARAEQLAPRGNLAEDALARSAEAWLRSRDRASATAAFARYRERYPTGRHLAFLERLLQTARK